MPGLNVYVVIDKEGHGEDAVVGARLNREEAEAMCREVAAEALDEMELEDDEDREEAEGERDTRYEIVEVVA